VSKAILKLSLIVLISLPLALYSGCGLIARLSSETSHEKRVPPEYDLAAPADNSKVLVYVQQPSWLKTPVDIRMHLTDAINAKFAEKTSLTAERLFSYKQQLAFRAAEPGRATHSIFELASGMGASAVLIVELVDFELSTFAEKNLYTGSLRTQSCLFNTAGQRLWPETGKCRDITVGIDFESGTAEKATDKLASAAAHCIVRYFYPCRKSHFNISEEKRYETDLW